MKILKSMLRLRWHHAFFIMASLEVVVIFLSLELHRQALTNVDRLVEGVDRIEQRHRWCERAEQCVLELNAPGNDIFRSRDVSRERNRLALATQRFEAARQDAEKLGIETGIVQRRVAEMQEVSNEVLEDFQKSQSESVDSVAQRNHLTRAVESMARMDAIQMQAMREIGMLSDRTTAGLRTLMDEHEADMQARINYERYFIASFIVLLAGILWFGYRLQRTQLALEAERGRVEAERRERLATIGELCSSVAHGIRNPLASIRSSAQLTLQLGSLDDASRSRLDDILTEGTRLGDRVTGLMNIARSSNAGFSQVELGRVVREVISGLGPEITRLGLKVAIEGQSDVPVWGDRRQLEQLVVELVSNAMEHSSEGGRIAVRVEESNEARPVRLTVEDEGPGVLPDLREKVFDLFYTTKPSGTGIGLATVKRIARLHGGDVNLGSAVPHGARFIVTLPAWSRDNGERRSA